MKPIKILIVEDELLIAETIKIYLAERGHKTVGIAISFDEVLTKIKTTIPDVILLDIRLFGKKSGIDIAKHLQSFETKIPFVMVSSQYDTDVIKQATLAGASGYITKPVIKENLWSAVELAFLKQKDETLKEEFVKLKVGNSSQKINVNEILYIKSDHVYVEVVSKTAKYLCRYTFKEISALLNSFKFIKCHRSYIINLDKVQKMTNKNVYIHDFEIPISENYKEKVLRLYADL